MKILLLGLAIIALVVGLGLALRRPPPPKTDDFARVPIARGSLLAEKDARFTAMLGEWRRVDGDYLLHVRRIGVNGTADVGYFNPAPIRVSVATTTYDDGMLKLFVELNDKGYPGSQYRLALKPGETVMRGTYFQAATKQTFEVAFNQAAKPATEEGLAPATAPAAPPPGR